MAEGELSEQSQQCETEAKGIDGGEIPSLPSTAPEAAEIQPISTDNKSADSPIIQEPTKADMEEPKLAPKKKLTLQERLALAAKRKALKTEANKSSSPKTSIELSSRENTPIPTAEPEDNPKNDEFNLPTDYKELSKDELLKLLDQAVGVIDETKSKNGSKVKDLSKLVDDLKSELQDQQRRQQQLARKNAAAPASSNDALKKKLEEKEIQIKELLQEGSKLSMKEVTLTQTLKKVKQKELDLEEDFNRSEKEVFSLHAKVEELENTIEKMRERERNSKEDRLGHESLQLKYDKLLEERDLVVNELKELKLRKLDVQLANTKKLLEEETKHSNSLQVKLDKVTDQFSIYKDESKNEISQLEFRLVREKTKLNETIEESSNEIKRLESKVEALRLMSESSTDKGVEATNNNGDQSSSISVDLLQAQYTQAQENWKLIESSYQKKISSLENDLEVLKQKDINYSKKIKTLTNDLKLKSGEINEALQNESSLRTELAEVQKLLETSKNDQETWKNNYEELKKDYEVEKKNIEKKIQALEEERTRLTNINKLRIDPQASAFQQPPPIGATGTPSGPNAGGMFYLNDLNSTSSLNYYRNHRSVSSASIDNIALGESSSTPRPGPFPYGPNRGQSSSSLYFSPGTAHNFNNSLQGDRSHGSLSLETIDDSINTTATTDDDLFPSSSPISGYRNRSTSVLNRVQSRDEFETPHSSTIGAGPGGSTSMNGGNNIQLMSKLSSRIRRLELEVMTLKDEITELNEQKQEASNKIIELIKDNEMTEKYKKKLASLEAEHNELTSNYEATLQLLGEKSERCGELEADVDDLKEMLRSQVQQLVELQEMVATKN